VRCRVSWWRGLRENAPHVSKRHMLSHFENGRSLLCSAGMCSRRLELPSKCWPSAIVHDQNKVRTRSA
jgi:hypothetical protein